MIIRPLNSLPEVASGAALGETPPPPQTAPPSTSSSSVLSSLPPETAQNGLGYTVSSLYIKKKDLPQFVQLDHLERRKKRDLADIVEVWYKQTLKFAEASRLLYFPLNTPSASTLK